MHDQHKQRADHDQRQRQDAHRPSVIEPTEYAFSFAVYFGPCYTPWDRAQRQRLRDLDQDGSRFVKANGRGQCDICGTWFMHGAAFRHVGGEVIVIGWQCAEKLDLMDADAFRAQKASNNSDAEAAPSPTGTTFTPAGDGTADPGPPDIVEEDQDKKE